MATHKRTVPSATRSVVVVAGDPRILERAVRYAIPGDRVIVVGAAQLRVAPVMTEGAQRDPSGLQRRRDDLDDAKAFLAEHGIEAETVFVQGDAAAAVLQAAEERDADLVIVGYERPGVLEHLVRGPVSDRVSHRTSCDVLVVH
jgi:nucleotide-binding universal stress UspA family protein